MLSSLASIPLERPLDVLELALQAQREVREERRRQREQAAS